MRGKDLLTALQVDATGSLSELSSFTYVYVIFGEKPTNRLAMQMGEDRIEISYEAKQPPLTVTKLVALLNQHKEAGLYLKSKNVQPVYGYRLVEDGIVIG